MAIVCGVDFSEPSTRASRVAGELAARMKVPLHLVYSLDLGEGRVFDAPSGTLRRWAEDQLVQIADSLRASGAVVELHVERGAPDEVLLNTARAVGATLIVIAALGHQPLPERELGGHADRLARRSHVPVLVVRNPEPLEAWARGARPLEVVVGLDSSAPSDAALCWVNELCRAGPCRVLGVHLYWPPPEFHRLGLGGVRSYLDPEPTVVLALEHELSKRMPAELRGSVRLRVEPHLGRIADRLADIAAEQAAELVVVGSHDRGPLARVWEGSVSRGVLHAARTSVACVPAPEQPAARAVPRVRCVLAASDLSEIGNAALALAYAVVEDGGTVNLVHVIRRTSADPLEPHDVLVPANQASEQGQRAKQALLDLVPPEAGRRCHTNVYVLESNRTAEAIFQAAERLDADVICLGTHGRTGLSKALLGSVAQSVLEITNRPVLFTRARPVR